MATPLPITCMPNRLSFDVLFRPLAVLGATAALAGAAHAQPVPDDVRAQVAAARLGAGYAQMINLSATPDLSAASYWIDGLDPGADLDVLRLPYEAKWLALSDAADLYWNVEGGWLRYGQEFRWHAAPDGAGTIGSKWTTYSVGAGVRAKVRVGRGGMDTQLAHVASVVKPGGKVMISSFQEEHYFHPRREMMLARLGTHAIAIPPRTGSESAMKARAAPCSTEPA